jgi:hypothetical protein
MLLQKFAFGEGCDETTASRSLTLDGELLMNADPHAL